MLYLYVNKIDSSAEIEWAMRIYFYIILEEYQEFCIQLNIEHCTCMHSY